MNLKIFEDEEFIDDKKEDEMYNAITKDGSRLILRMMGTCHIRPEDGDPIEIEEHKKPNSILGFFIVWWMRMKI